MRVIYFASDINDAASLRRIRMLRLAGVEMRILGFHRREYVPVIEGFPVIDLGKTTNGKLASRCLQILRWAMDGKLMREVVADADVLMGRNLEMVTLAHFARLWSGSSAALVYECLDIHAAFLGTGLPSKLLRGWERQILRSVDTLVVSSPGYIRNYFDRVRDALPNVIVAENKRVMDWCQEHRPEIHQAKPPWKIGWFGGLRCEKSFQLLLELATRCPDLVDIDIRGKPQVDSVTKLIARHLPLPNMRFHGAYSQDDLGDIYRMCDLVWGIEYFGRGMNSDWCLANRIYEGGYYNRPIITLAGTETTAWLQARGSGLVLSDPDSDLIPTIQKLTVDDYERLHHACTAIPSHDLVWSSEACHAFAMSIGERRRRASVDREAAFP